MVKKHKTAVLGNSKCGVYRFSSSKLSENEEILPDSNLLNNNEIFQMFFCLNFEDDIIKYIENDQLEPVA